MCVLYRAAQQESSSAVRGQPAPRARARCSEKKDLKGVERGQRVCMKNVYGHPCSL